MKIEYKVTVVLTEEETKAVEVIKNIKCTGLHCDDCPLNICGRCVSGLCGDVLEYYESTRNGGDDNDR